MSSVDRDVLAAVQTNNIEDATVSKLEGYLQRDPISLCQQIAQSADCSELLVKMCNDERTPVIVLSCSLEYYEICNYLLAGKDVARNVQKLYAKLSRIMTHVPTLMFKRMPVPGSLFNALEFIKSEACSSDDSRIIQAFIKATLVKLSRHGDCLSRIDHQHIDSIFHDEWLFKDDASFKAQAPIYPSAIVRLAAKLDISDQVFAFGEGQKFVDRFEKVLAEAQAADYVAAFTNNSVIENSESLCKTHLLTLLVTLDNSSLLRDKLGFKFLSKSLSAIEQHFLRPSGAISYMKMLSTLNSPLSHLSLNCHILHELGCLNDFEYLSGLDLEFTFARETPSVDLPRWYQEAMAKESSETEMIDSQSGNWATEQSEVDHIIALCLFILHQTLEAMEVSSFASFINPIAVEGQVRMVFNILLAVLSQLRTGANRSSEQFISDLCYTCIVATVRAYKYDAFRIYLEICNKLAMESLSIRSILLNGLVCIVDQCPPEDIREYALGASCLTMSFLSNWMGENPSVGFVKGQLKDLLPDRSIEAV